MLRAALIGFRSSGKTTLFDLMTRSKDSSRAAHGRAEASIGISKVPDGRLERLNVMFNPRKRVPARSSSRIRGGAELAALRLVDAAACKNADASSMDPAFDDPAVRIRQAIDPGRDAQAMKMS